MHKKFQTNICITRNETNFKRIVVLEAQNSSLHQ